MLKIGLISAYIKPLGIHLDIDADRAYRLAKNDAHREGLMQPMAANHYLDEMNKTGNVYVPYSSVVVPIDQKIFASDLIMSQRS